MKTHHLKLLKPLFWDTPLKHVHFKDFPDWVVLRVLDYGNLDQLKVVLKLYGLEQVVAVFKRGKKKLSPKTQSFWQLFC